MADFIDSRADEVSEEESDFDSETGQRRNRQNGNRNRRDIDSSEEEESDDEEAQRKVAEGFIVDDEEDEEEDDAERIARKKKRRREEREKEMLLDEEDLDLIGFQQEPDDGQRKFKRLKQGHRDRPSALEISDEEIEEYADVRGADEFADFIEEDVFSDDEQDKIRDDIEVGRPGRKHFSVAGLTAGLDERALEDYAAAFGDGGEYGWALDMEQEAADEEKEEKPLELKDIFEPAQLAEKLLTEDDLSIRNTDIPERFQLAWKNINIAERPPEETDQILADEAAWITSLMLPKKPFGSSVAGVFEKAVTQILKFFNDEDKHYEVPFIFQHRRDFIVHEIGPGEGPDRLLNQTDLWEIFELDLRFKSLLEKRQALSAAYKGLQEYADVKDSVIEELLPKTVTAEEVQDILDYMHFQYSAQLKDVQAMTAVTNGTTKRPRAAKDNWEVIRGSKAYNFVRAIGMTTDDFARNTLGVDTRVYTEDATERPDDLADTLLDPPRYNTSTQLLKAAKAMFVQELSNNPRMRQFMRKSFFVNGVIDCHRTSKGAIEVTEDHRYYEFKYLRNIEFSSIARKPESFLRMLKAEQEGLIDIKFRILNVNTFRQKLYSHIETDNFSDAADAWNTLRREWVDSALDNLEQIISRGVKEALKTECENTLARMCRHKYSEKLDQAPHKPPGMQLGTPPSVLALSNGNGVPGRDAIVWVFLDENGRMVDNGKFDEIRAAREENRFIPQGADNTKFLDLVQRRRPDVIGISGFSPETQKLRKELQDILDVYAKEEKEKRDRNKRPGDSDDESEDDEFHKPDVVIVNDEVARLYYNSDRAQAQFPYLPPMARYCVALARYLRSPLLEYASLGQDILSIKFDSNQDLVPVDKLSRHLETAIVDIVNLVGVDLDEALSDPYISKLLPYICGLGPRKAARLIETISQNGGVVTSRKELLGEAESRLAQACGPIVWFNCASFLSLSYNSDEPNSDPLDSTRIHPEDYVIASKVAADALDIDEEDIAYENRTGGASAVVRRLFADKNAEDVLGDLELSNFANELEQRFNQHKRCNLETIRGELMQPYEELRGEFANMNPEDIFTMLTGETKESLADGMIVPVKIRKVHRDRIEVRLDCGIEGGVSQDDYSSNVRDNVSAKDYYTPGQTTQAKVLFLNRKSMVANLSFREDMLRRVYNKPTNDRLPGEWNSTEEADDQRRAVQDKESKTGRPHRVIKHPLFRPYNSIQAEEYLGSRNAGDVVIRPSSRGIDHLAITWKVADNVFQHVDVLELDKENEYAVGKTLKIGGKYTYSDLDDLIVNHIEAMAKKVVEMTNDQRYQKGSRTETEQWLSIYTEANPNRSMYAFCINPKFPGYFNLCFKAGQAAKPGCWSVKVVPNGFELRNIQYPNMQALKNGFKLLMANDASKNGPPGRR